MFGRGVCLFVCLSFCLSGMSHFLLVTRLLQQLQPWKRDLPLGNMTLATDGLIISGLRYLGHGEIDISKVEILDVTLF